MASSDSFKSRKFEKPYAACASNSTRTSTSLRPASKSSRSIDPNFQAAHAEAQRNLLSQTRPPHSSLRGKSLLPILPDLPITETIDEVIVHHADRLHVGI